MPEVVAHSCVVTGRVQAVGFRWWAKQVADELGVTGWVRNGPHGQVELMFQGDADLVEAFVARLAEGPPMAAVTDLTVTDVVPHDAIAEFEIRS